MCGKEHGRGIWRPGMKSGLGPFDSLGLRMLIWKTRLMLMETTYRSNSKGVWESIKGEQSGSFLAFKVKLGKGKLCAAERKPHLCNIL